MEKNVGDTDRAVRLVLGLVLVGTWLFILFEALVLCCIILFIL